MSYFSLNGKKNTIIPGLVLSAIPPISMPKNRYKITEVPGRDGDIVEKLGYSAYDKEILIGIDEKTDVNDVNKYFKDNASGKLVFSNEPDLYYDYEIIEAINYEQLIKFKTATVTFHVQPFKYLDYEPSFIFNNIPNNEELLVSNQGNYDSKPIIKISLSDYSQINNEDKISNLYVNDNLIATIDLTTAAGDIIIDSTKEDAYDSNNLLKNTSMNGQFPIFKPGINKIRFSNVNEFSINSITVNPKSRWL